MKDKGYIEFVGGPHCGVRCRPSGDVFYRMAAGPQSDVLTNLDDYHLTGDVKKGPLTVVGPGGMASYTLINGKWKYVKNSLRSAT